MKIKGFTLAELLIALAILGVIATFTIPKVLQSQQDTRNKSIAKESAGFISDAYQTLRLKVGVSTGTRLRDITPYLNYVAQDTVSVVDAPYLGTTRDCSTGSFNCLKLHNGAVMWYDNTTFNGTFNTSAVYFAIDPDGIVTDGTTNGPGKSVGLWLYYDGRVRDRGNIVTNTCDSSNCYNPSPAQVPPWFSWD